MKALALVVLLAGVARAQEDPGYDEPVPVEPPPVIYVPLPPPPAAPATRPSTSHSIVLLGVGGAYRYALKASFGAAAAHVLIGGDSGAVRFGGVIDVEMQGVVVAGAVLQQRHRHRLTKLSGRIGDRLRAGLSSRT